MRAPEESTKEEEHSNEEDFDEEKAATEKKKQLEIKMNYKLFGEGRCFLAPSFFRTMMYLKK